PSCHSPLRPTHPGRLHSFPTRRSSDLREKTPSELSEQFPVLKELLDSFGIAHYELDQYEADDIIGTLSKKGNDADWDVTVISGEDRKSTRLNSSHVSISYAVFCLKKKT